MGHAQMLKIRRQKQSNRKHLAGVAKRAKKLRNQDVKTASAGGAKVEST